MCTRYDLVLLVLIFVCSVSAQNETSDPFVMSLFDRIKEEQILKEERYSELQSWKKIKGLYSSAIRLNYHGKFPASHARRLSEVFDDNVFVTISITSVLLEAFKYGKAPRPSDEQLILTINALKRFHEENRPYNTSIMSFYEPVFDESTNQWKFTPENLQGVLNMVFNLPLTSIQTVLNLLGEKEFAFIAKLFANRREDLLTAMYNPTDFDTSFANLALGSLLHCQKDVFPEAWSLWSRDNTNITSVFDAMKQYAYRPFSDDRDVNTISPTTYYFIREFLYQAKRNGQDIAVLPTWLQYTDKQRQEGSPDRMMTFWTNCVDLGVNANSVFAITSLVLSGVVDHVVLEDPAIAQIYENMSSLVEYEIRNNFSDRMDLAFTYYSSKMQFYWSLSKTVYLQENARRKEALPVKIMETVYRRLRGVLEDVVTKDILSSANREGENLVYFDDFLGNGDLTFDDKPIIRGEDRIFTTANAALTLLNTWTYYDEDSAQSHWKEGTPESVRATIQGSINWLRRYTLDGKYPPWNSFFVSGMLGFETVSFWYPGNRLEYFNGTSISDWSKIPDEMFIYAVQGYIPEDQYNAMLNETHFGQQTPRTFSGFNSKNNIFNFWCSVPYTYAITLLAVSRFNNTVD